MPLGCAALQEAVSSSSPPLPPSSSGRPSSGSGGGSGGASRRTTGSSHEEATAGAGGGSPQAEATIRPQRDGVQVAALRSMSETRISKFNRLLDEQASSAWDAQAAVCGLRLTACCCCWCCGCGLATLTGTLAGTLPKLYAFEQPPSGHVGRLLALQVVDLEALRELAWSGIPAGLRPTCWRLLLGYLPPNRERRMQARPPRGGPGRTSAAPAACRCVLGASAC